jgi:hypothetical protein
MTVRLGVTSGASFGEKLVFENEVFVRFLSMRLCNAVPLPILSEREGVETVGGSRSARMGSSLQSYKL